MEGLGALVVACGRVTVNVVHEVVGLGALVVAWVMVAVVYEAEGLGA